MNTTLEYIVTTSAARMPASCEFGTYRHAAVLAVTSEAAAAHRSGKARLTIDARRRGVVEVVATWRRLNVGTTSRCAYQRALVEAHALARALNAARGSAPVDSTSR